MPDPIAGMPRVTPSNIDPWHGTRDEGERFTREQLRELAGRHIDPRTVKSHRQRLEYRLSFNEPPQVTHVECPFLQHSKRGGRILIISPAGHHVWVKP